MIRSLVRGHRVILFTTLLVSYWIVLFGVTGIRDEGEFGHSFIRLAISAIELAFIGLCCAGCLRIGRGRWRWPFLVLAVVLAGIAAVGYLIQEFSLFLSGNFVTVLALQNSDSIDFISSAPLLGWIAATMAWISLFALCVVSSSKEKERSQWGMAERWTSRTYVGVLLSFLALFAYVLTIQGASQRLEPHFQQAPLSSLLMNWYRAHTAAPRIAAWTATPGEPACYPYPSDLSRARFPFQQEQVYRNALPYPSKEWFGKTKPNVIVIFSEGTSARLLGTYGGNAQYPDLTPNIDRFASKSMRVDNYFNHTAATFRGHGGQMTSGFAATDGGGPAGWEAIKDSSSLTGIQRASLPSILKQRQYDSYFFSPHHKTRALNTMLRSLGFDEVYDYESIGQTLLKGKFSERSGTGALEDQSLFSGLQAFLKERESEGDEKPFFIGTYNIGTHAFIEPESDNVFYGESDNRALNKLHNYDAAFGQFLDWFEHSPFARNTILILTSDHATYPEKPYRDVAGPDLKPYFVDRIPLIVRDPFHDLPSTLNADGRTSLELAPTVLQLLGVKYAQNSFLGRSLFEQRSMSTGIASVDTADYMTLSNGVFSSEEVPANYRKIFQCEVGVVRRYYLAEQENRIFSPDKDAKDQ